MKKIIILILLIAVAIAALTTVVIPSVWSDGKLVKQRSQAEYQNMFQ